MTTSALGFLCAYAGDLLAHHQEGGLEHVNVCSNGTPEFHSEEEFHAYLGELQSITSRAPNLSAHERMVASAKQLVKLVEAGDDPECYVINPVTGGLEDRWVHIRCKTTADAIARAVDTCGFHEVTFSGDFGQDDGEAGCGCDHYTILFHANGAATLCVRYVDNERYLKK